MDSQINPGRVIGATCEELFERGQTENGLYLIQPSLDVEPFEVNCDFDNQPVLTIVSHDQPEKKTTATLGQHDGCESKFTYSAVW